LVRERDLPLFDTPEERKHIAVIPFGKEFADLPAFLRSLAPVPDVPAHVDGGVPSWVTGLSGPGATGFALGALDVWGVGGAVPVLFSVALGFATGFSLWAWSSHRQDRPVGIVRFVALALSALLVVILGIAVLAAKADESDDRGNATPTSTPVETSSPDPAPTPTPTEEPTPVATPEPYELVDRLYVSENDSASSSDITVSVGEIASRPPRADDVLLDVGSRRCRFDGVVTGDLLRLHRGDYLYRARVDSVDAEFGADFTVSSRFAPGVAAERCTHDR
jgi:hypothetical protein